MSVLCMLTDPSTWRNGVLVAKHAFARHVRLQRLRDGITGSVSCSQKVEIIALYYYKITV
jgi:hypothetical protein